MLYIDTHCHLFNAKDLPIAGFVSRQEIPYVPRLLEKPIMELLGQIAESYFRIQTPSLDVESRVDRQFLLHDLVEGVGEKTGQLSGDQTKVHEKYLAFLALVEQNEDNRELLTELESWELESDGIGAADFFPNPVVWLAKKLVRKLLGRFLKWLDLLSSSHEDIEREMVSTYPEVSLSTPMMLDFDNSLARWNPANNLDERILTMKRTVLKQKGRIHPFAPFDPIRAAEDPGALERVKKCVLGHGFIGVKLYPPMGFLPSFKNSNSQVNAALRSLYEFCIENEVPITAHCTPKGAQARPDLNSGLNSDPENWREVLETDGLKDLRINLAHFGGLDQLLDQSDQSWSRKIAKLMEDFPGVFADGGHHGLHKEKKRMQYARRLDSLSKDHPVLMHRIMLGTDWHMIVRERGAAEFIDNYEQVIYLMKENLALRDFAFSNAASFLGLEKGMPNRVRLESFYAEHNISIPNWAVLLDSNTY